MPKNEGHRKLRQSSSHTSTLLFVSGNDPAKEDASTANAQLTYFKNSASLIALVLLLGIKALRCFTGEIFLSLFFNTCVSTRPLENTRPEVEYMVCGQVPLLASRCPHVLSESI